MLNSTIMKVAITLILIGYVSYTTFKSITLFITYKKSLPNFLETHKDAELYTDSPLWWIVTSLLSILSLVMAVVTQMYPTDQAYYFTLAYVAIAIIFVGLAFETYVRKRVYLTDDGIYYVGKVYRYRMMVNFEAKKSFIKNIRILMNDKEKIEVSKKMGLKIKEAHDLWKKNKKEKRR